MIVSPASRTPRPAAAPLLVLVLALTWSASAVGQTAPPRALTPDRDVLEAPAQTAPTAPDATAPVDASPDPEASAETPPFVPTGRAPAAAPADPPDEAVVPVDGIVVGALPSVDPAAVGLLDGEAGLGADLWRGADRALLDAWVAQLPGNAGSPTLGALARTLLLTRAELPSAADPAAPSSLFAARVDRLLAIGAAADAVELGRLAPATYQDPALDRAMILAHLAIGETEAACARVAAIASEREGAFWLRAQAVCRAIAGDFVGANTSADLMAEFYGEDLTLYAVLDQAAGVAAGLESLAQADPLYIALLSAARRPIPDDVLSGADGAGLAMLARSMSVAPAVRVAAVERLAMRGAVPPGRLAEVYETVPGEAAPATPSVETEGGEVAASPIADARLRAEVRARAALWRAAARTVDAGERRAALRDLWAAAEDPMLRVVLMRLSALRALDLPPTPDGLDDHTAVVRALAVDGRIEAALRWDSAARQMLTDGTLEAADVIRTSWPLLRLGSTGPRRIDAATELAPWREGLPADAAQAHRQEAMALTLMQALGHGVPDGAWRRLVAAEDTAAEGGIGTAAWHALWAATEGQRRGEALLLTMRTAADQGLAGTPPVVISQKIYTLRALGFEAEARSLALEAAVAAGL